LSEGPAFRGTYIPFTPDPKALAVNALAVSWDGMNAYAFPPTPLLQAVLNKAVLNKMIKILN
jgi:hypothetical protein